MNQKRQFQSSLGTIQQLKEKKDPFIHSRLELLTRVSGLVVLEMGKVSRYGQTELVMKVTHNPYLLKINRTMEGQ
jgi:hypothetical protein